MSHLSRRIVAGVGMALIALFASQSRPARAQVVYDNGGPVGAPLSRDISKFAIADDFSVATSLSFNAIRFWAVDLPVGLLPNFSGTLTWYIHNSNGNIPDATIVASGTSSAISITPTGELLMGMDVAQMDFLIPTVNLGPGTYWLRLKEGTATSTYDGTEIGWAQTTAFHGNGFRSHADEVNPGAWATSRTDTTEDMAFQFLDANSINPEPGSLALAGMVVAGVGVLRGRRRRK
jgi:hypothetical protein